MAAIPVPGRALRVDSALRQLLGLTFTTSATAPRHPQHRFAFCDEHIRLYGSDDYNEAMGAAFAVENWAAAGFWKELISGLEKMKAKKFPDAARVLHLARQDRGPAQVARLGRAQGMIPVAQVPRRAVHQCRREDARRA